MNPRPTPKRPSVQLVEHYWQKYRAEQKYLPGDRAVRTAFTTFPHNRSEAHVRLKACVLNDIYSTNMVDTGAAAQHISRLRIDRRLRRHDLELVNDIADVPKSGGARRAYSFASKYCALHEPKAYPIYDSFVDCLLWLYQLEDEFSSFRRKDLKDYPTFVAILEDFRTWYGLKSLNLRTLDKFLWLYGKETL